MPAQAFGLGRPGGGVEFACTRTTKLLLVAPMESTRKAQNCFVATESVRIDDDEERGEKEK